MVTKKEDGVEKMKLAYTDSLHYSELQYLARNHPLQIHLQRILTDIINQQKIPPSNASELITLFSKLRTDITKVPPEDQQTIINKEIPVFEELLMNTKEILAGLGVRISVREIVKLAKDDEFREGCRIVGEQVKNLLIMREREAATETAVNFIEQHLKIYTCRHDQQPEVWVYQEGIYAPNGECYVREVCRKILGQAYKPQFATEVIAKIQTDTYIEQEEFFNSEANKRFIPLENGILDLDTKKLYEFSEELIFFSKLPIRYNPQAECPMIQQFFRSVLPSENDIALLQELFGYSIYREDFAEKMAMFLGCGRNGKGKTLSLLKAMLGAKNVSNIPLQRLEKDGWSVGELFGKLCNLGADISSKPIKDTSTLKGLSGRDTINAPRKFKTDLVFTSYANHIFCANELPVTYDTTPAFFQRWLFIDFPFVFIPQKEYNDLPNDKRENYKIQDPDIIFRIQTPEEMSGLFNWALVGLERLIKNKAFSYSKTAAEIKEHWLRRSSSIAGFCMDCLTEDYESSITKADLRKEYNIYCRKHKLRCASDKEIKYYLEVNLGATEERRQIVEGDSRPFCWVGVNLITPKKEKNGTLNLSVEDVI